SSQTPRKSICEGSSKRCPACMTAPSVPTCMPSSIQASYSLPAGVLRRAILGARSRNLGSMRPVYMSGGSTMWESAEISLYPAITDLLRLLPVALECRPYLRVGTGYPAVGLAAAVRDFGNTASHPRAVSALDRLLLFTATCGNAPLAHLRSRHPGQSAAR